MSKSRQNTSSTLFNENPIKVPSSKRASAFLVRSQRFEQSPDLMINLIMRVKDYEKT